MVDEGANEGYGMGCRTKVGPDVNFKEIRAAQHPSGMT